MSGDGHAKRPIIIKRKAAHDDEHGGHWKIAYADFVTAMMAFFLVMWLVNAVSDKQRRGIAAYFSATSITDLRTGNGMLDGSHSVMNGADAQMVPISDKDPADDGGEQDQTDAPSAPGDATTHGRLSKSGDEKTDAQRLNAVRAELDRMTQEGELKKLSQNILVEVTPDGLRVQIFDRDGEPMFNAGSAEPNHRLTTILDALMPVLAGVPNGMIITGHTDAAPLDRPSYSNWELSADRANGTRRYLEAHGIAPVRIFKVEGRAAADLLLPAQPDDPRNRRIALTLMRVDVAAQMRSAATPVGGKGT